MADGFTLGDEYAEPGETIDRQAAIRILSKRLPSRAGYSDNQLTRRIIATAMLEQLPPEAWTENVLRTVDLRPLLRPYATTAVQAATLPKVIVEDVSGGGGTSELTPQMRENMVHLLVEFREQARAQLETEYLAQGAALDEAQMLVDEQLRSTESSTELHRLIIDPEMAQTTNLTGGIVRDPTTGEASVIGGANAQTRDLAEMLNQALNADQDTSDLPPFLTQRDLEIMLQTNTPGTVFGRYHVNESKKAAYRELGQTVPSESVNVNFGDASPGAQPRPSRPDTSSLSGIAGASSDYGRTYTLSQALQLPMSMTRQEIAALTEKMKKAGIFTQIDGGGPTVAGDPTDPQFTRGYHLLLSKQLSRGGSINDLLTEDTLAHAEALSDTVRTRLTDPARIRAAADTIARAELGRTLSDREVAGYVKALHEMQRKQTVAEADETGGDVTDVDWEARMNELIVGDNQGEAGAHDIAGQFDVFQSLLGGPGRDGRG